MRTIVRPVLFYLVLLLLSDRALSQVYCAGGDAQIRCSGSECYCPGGGGSAPAQQQYQPPTPAQQATAMNEQGHAAFRAGNYELAARIYEQALRLNPYDAVIANNVRNARARPYSLRGNAAFASGDWGRAISQYEEGLRQNPSDAVIAQSLRRARANFVNQKGVAAAAAGDWELALKLQREAAKLDPSNGVIANNVKIAERNIKQAAATVINDKGVEAAKAGDWVKAAKLYEEAARINPQSPVIADNFKKARAIALSDEAQDFSIKDPVKSLALYEQAARSDPTNETIAAGLKYTREFVERRRIDEIKSKQQEVAHAQETKLNGESLQSSIKNLAKSLDTTASPTVSGPKSVKVEVASGGSLGFMDANQTTPKGSGLFNSKAAAPTAEDLGGPASTKASATSKTVVDQAAAAASALNSKAGCVYDGQAGCEPASANINNKAQIAAAQSGAAVAMAETIRKNKQAMDNPVIARNLEFYLQADKIVAEKQAKLEEVQKKLKSGDGDPGALKAQEGTFKNDINISNANKNAAIRQMKDEVKDKKLDIAVEFPAEVAVPTSAIDPAKIVKRLDFIGVPSPGVPQ